MGRKEYIKKRGFALLSLLIKKMQTQEPCNYNRLQRAGLSVTVTFL